MTLRVKDSYRKLVKSDRDPNQINKTILVRSDRDPNQSVVKKNWSARE